MNRILIVEQRAETIEKVISLLKIRFPNSDISQACDIDTAIDIIKSNNPTKIILDFSINDKKGNNLLDILGTWNFEVLIYLDNDFYILSEGKKLSRKGYVFKKLNDLINNIFQFSNKLNYDRIFSTSNLNKAYFYLLLLGSQ